MAKMTLDEIAILAGRGDEDALRRVYEESRGMLRSMANLYFMVGADRDDVVQEGMIGLLGAIRTFNPEAGASFKTFSEFCVKRRIINAVKMAGRKKHRPLNESVSIYAVAVDGNEGGDGLASGKSLEDTLHAPHMTDPEEIVLLADLLGYVESNASVLFSELERMIWEEYSHGLSTAQISEKLSKPYKSVDNALTRIKGKIEKLVSMY
jgi:RNA polymerase sporulation-specific sigma factor